MEAGVSTLHEADKILLVDDSRTIRKIIRKALSSYSCTILEAANGREALEIAGHESPGLIILDINMPELDGGETLRQLKGNPSLSVIPVMMLTANADRENITKFYEMGAVDYVTKSLNPADVIERVKRVVMLKSQISG